MTETTTDTAPADAAPTDHAAAAPPKTSPFADGADIPGADTPIIEITESAMETVLGILAGEDQPETLGLRIEVTGVRGVEFTYDLSFDELDAAASDDEIIAVDPIKVIVPFESVEQLRGSVLDLPKSSAQGGLVIRNPNRPNPLEGVELNLEGTLAEKVGQLLEQSVNPSLAAHGGFATLVGVDDDAKVYITMGGGCQGCAMSRLTLTEGIQRSILEAIPEVSEVIDATDHAAGENPFY